LIVVALFYALRDLIDGDRRDREGHRAAWLAIVLGAAQTMLLMIVLIMALAGS
jgi:hypothetical protein